MSKSDKLKDAELMCVKCGKMMGWHECTGYASYPCCDVCFKDKFGGDFSRYQSERIQRGHF